MPAIPGDFVQSVMPQGEIAPMRIQASPADFGAQTGQTLEQGANELMQQAVARQQFQNETTVNDVINNKFFPAFQDQYKNYYALQGKDALDQLPAYQQAMRDLFSSYRESFSNPMQQRLFDQQVTRRMQFELAGMGRYADQQNKVWQAQTSQATVQRAIGSAADKYNDQRLLYGGVMATANEIARYGAIAGQGEDVINQRRQEAWDKLYSTVIERQALDPAMGPQAANDTFQDGIKRGFVSGSAQLAIARYLKPLLNLADAQKAYVDATGGGLASRIAKAANESGVDPNTALTIASIESGLNPQAQNPDSSAHGIFQHLDSTWQDLGGTAENRNDPDAQIAIGIKGLKEGREQLASALKREPLPWELYLAHQQGVTGAESLLHADPNAKAATIVGEKAVTQNGGSAEETVGQFLDRTQNLIAKKSMLFTDQGLPSAQGIEENYAAGLDAMTRMAQREHPGDPQALERYRSVYIQQAGQTLRAAQMTDRAQREIMRSGLLGPNGAKSWSEFFSDPQRARAYADTDKTDPDLSSLVDRVITANATGTWDPPASQKTEALFNELKGMETTDRDGFAGIDLMQNYGTIPASQLDELQKDQAGIRNRDSVSSAKNIDMTHAVTLLRPLFDRAGIRPDTSTSADPGMYKAAVGRLDRALQKWSENNSGKRPDDGEIMETGVRTLFPDRAPDRSWSSLFSVISPDEALAKSGVEDNTNTDLNTDARESVVNSNGKPDRNGSVVGGTDEAALDSGRMYLVPGAQQSAEIETGEKPDLLELLAEKHPKLAVINDLPEDAVPHLAPDGQTFFAPSGADSHKVYEAGKANGLDLTAALRSVGHFGTFDFQRQESKKQFVKDYEDASNFAVGVYMRGAGFSLGMTKFIAGLFAHTMSSNAGSPKQSAWWTNGWYAADQGMYSKESK